MDLNHGMDVCWSILVRCLTSTMNSMEDKLDGSSPLVEKYLGASVVPFVGKTKTELTRVNSQCAVGEVVSALGQYVEFCITKLETESNAITQSTGSGAGAKEDAFTLLMRGA